MGEKDMWEEVVQVTLQVSDTERVVASGYALSPQLVLTAAHVVEHGNAAIKDAEITVTSQHSSESSKIIWRGDIANLDAALLELEAPLSGITSNVRWGKLTSTSTAVEVTAMGFPRAMMDDSGTRVPEQAVGTMTPGVDFGRRYDLRLHPPYPQAMSLAGSPWAGFSGAAALARGLVVGLVAIDVPGFRSGRLSCVPAWRLLETPGFRRGLERHGIPASWESVELEGVLVRTAPARWVYNSPASLFRADAAVVRFRGRQEELERLVQWCTTDSPRGISLITGPGGQGKTRLANRFSHLLHTREGWATGFISAGIAQSEIGRIGDAAVSTLLMIDYAETRTDDITKVLAATARSAGKSRVLLIARSDGEWWRQMRTKIAPFSADPVLRINLDSLEHSVLGREAAYLEAIEDLAVAISSETGAESQIGPTLAKKAPELASATYESALSIQLRALLELLADSVDSAETSEQLESRLLDHEEGYWFETAARHGIVRGPYDGAALRAAVAVASMCGAANRAQALALLATVPGLRDGRESELLAITRWLGDLYPRPDGQQWGALQPDRVAEHLIAEISEQEPEMIFAALRSIEPDQKRRAMTVLVRAAVHHPRVGSIIESAISSDFAALAPIGAEVAMQTEAPAAMVSALSHSLDTSATLEDLEQLARVIPMPRS